MARMRSTGSAPPRQHVVASLPLQRTAPPSQAHRLRISAINHLRVETTRQTAMHPDRATSIQTKCKSAIAIVENMTNEQVLARWGTKGAT